MNNILYTPLDLPIVPKELTLDSIRQHFHYSPDQNKKEQYRNENRLWLSEWNVLKLRIPASTNSLESHFHKQLIDSEYVWTEEAKLLIPETIKWIETNLPFTNLKYVAALVSDGTVIAHSDLNRRTTQEQIDIIKSQDPSMYRLVIDGSIDQNSFYVENERLGKKYITLPSNSPGWAMSAVSCLHGNDQVEKNKKMLMYVMGDLDMVKHTELITRSVEKFSDYVIYDI